MERGLSLVDREDKPQQESNGKLETDVLASTQNHLSNEGNILLTLPNELTCKILLLTRGSWVSQPSQDKPFKSLPMEIIMCSVCRQWRNVAQNFPPLWAAFSYIGRKERRIPLPRLNLYLKWSRNLPLDLVFDMKKAVNKAIDEHMLLITMSMDHVHRWRSFKLTSDIDAPILSISPRLSQLSAPRLECLEIRPGTYYHRDIIPFNRPPILRNIAPNIFVGGTPKLSYVFINEPGNLFCMPSLTNITTLRLEGELRYTRHSLSFPASVALLSLPFLTNLSLKTSYFFEPPPEGIPEGFSISMPHLKSLRFSERAFLDEILFYLDAPCLQHLTLHTIEEPVKEDTINRPTVNYPFSALRTLTLVDSSLWIYSAESNSLLSKLCPNINFLSISCRRIYPVVYSETSVERQHRDQAFETWSALRTVTIDPMLESSEALDFYSQFWFNTPKIPPVTIRIREGVFMMWQTELDKDHLIAEAACVIDLIEESNYQATFLSSQWPEDEISNQVVRKEDMFYDECNFLN